MSNAPQLIDLDVHNNFLDRKEELLPFLPKVWHQQWIEDGIGLGGKPFSSVGVTRKDVAAGKLASRPETLLKDHVEKYGVDYAILTGSAIMVGVSLHYDPDYANALASAFNDWLAERWLKASPKFKGSILINNSDPVAAAAEIDRMAKHPDMVQVLMCSASPRLYGQRFYHPIYEAAERNGLPVAIHLGPDGMGIAGAPTQSGYPTRYMELQNIVTTNYMVHVNSMICEGVFEKYPGLQFICIEGGISWMAHLMWRMDKNYKALRDTVPWLRKLPSEYIKQHVWLTTQPIEEPKNPQHLVDIIKMCELEDRIMFSSDYPHWDFDNPHVVFKHFPKDLREKVLAKNAIKLFGLTEKPVTTEAGVGNNE